VQKEQVSLALSKNLIKLIDKRGGGASRSAEGECLVKLDATGGLSYYNKE
jgi:hypothetical protein